MAANLKARMQSFTKAIAGCCHMHERRTYVGGSRYMLTANGPGGSPVIPFVFGLSRFLPR